MYVHIRTHTLTHTHTHTNVLILCWQKPSGQGLHPVACHGARLALAGLLGSRYPTVVHTKLIVPLQPLGSRRAAQSLPYLI